MDRIRKPPNSTRSREIVRKLRAQPTDAEQNLWYHLRAGRMQSLKWRRQHPLHPHVVDFYCHQLRLVVELDGGNMEKWLTPLAPPPWSAKACGY